MNAPQRVVFAPAPPLLPPELGRGLDAELADLRAAVHAAVAELDCAGTVLLLGAGGEDRVHAGDASGTLAGYGVPLRAGGSAEPPTLPASLTIGCWLLEQAGVTSVRVPVELGDAPDPGSWPLPADPWALLVLGEGSAGRTEKAPLALVPGAAAVDADWLARLASGDPAVLAAGDLEAAERAGAAGTRVWVAAARLLTGHGGGTTYDATLLSAEAPYGVTYPLAVWTPRP